MTRKVSESAHSASPPSDYPPLHNHIGTTDNKLSPLHVPLTNGPVHQQKGREPPNESPVLPPTRVVIAVPHKPELKDLSDTPRTLRSRESSHALKSTSLLSLGDNGDIVRSEKTFNSQLKIKNSFNVTESSSSTCSSVAVCSTHNGPSQQHSERLLVSNSRTKADGLVLRTGSAPNLRHRPYTISHKTS